MVDGTVIYVKFTKWMMDYAVVDVDTSLLSTRHPQHLMNNARRFKMIGKFADPCALLLNVNIAGSKEVE